MKAVEDISFVINKGEAVAYLGANGAGKSTTIKMLSGILTPTTGNILVKGIVPYENREKNAHQIGVVFGQRTQLHWDLPVKDSYELYQLMYKIDETTFRKNLNFYIELMEMEKFYEKPVRKLSLGQKMRAELVGALLHDPEILYLDEPTIGLDVNAKRTMRNLIKTINKERNTTVMLTTHDMRDIDEICDRIIILQNGKIKYDGSKSNFISQYGGKEILVVEFTDDINLNFAQPLNILEKIGNKITFEFDREEINIKDAITSIMRLNDIVDIKSRSIEIEDILRKNI